MKKLLVALMILFCGSYCFAGDLYKGVRQISNRSKSVDVYFYADSVEVVAYYDFNIKEEVAVVTTIENETHELHKVKIGERIVYVYFTDVEKVGDDLEFEDFSSATDNTNNSTRLTGFTSSPSKPLTGAQRTESFKNGGFGTRSGARTNSFKNGGRGIGRR